MVFAVSLDAIAAVDISLDFATANDTAEAGADYEATSGRLIIPAGNASGEISVTVYSDDQAEENEQLKLILTNLSDGTISGPASTDGATGTINNTDTPIIEPPEPTEPSGFTIFLPIIQR